MSDMALSPRQRASGLLPQWRRWLPWVMGVVAVTYPFWYGVPPFGYVLSDGLGLELDVVIVMYVYVLLALGLNVVVGSAGLLDLGYVAFFALGAYTIGWFASDKFSGVNFHFLSTTSGAIPGIHVNVWLVFVMAGVVAAIGGVIIGWPTLRLRGDYLAIVTLGFGEIIPDVFRNSDSLPVPSGLQGSLPFFEFSTVNLTNGVQGIRPLDRPGFGEQLNTLTGGLLPERFGGLALRPWYFAIVAMVIVAIFIFRRIDRSKMGRAWVAVREDEIAASAMGIPLMRTKLWAYGIGAVSGGVVGAYYGSFVGSVFPTSFSFAISVLILCMVIVGGMGNITGVILGALVLQYLNVKGLEKIGNGLNSGIDLFGIDAAIDVPKYKVTIFGVLLVTMMLFRPEGMLPSARRKAELHEAEEDLAAVEDDLYDTRREGE
jgi:branched-chain amino acid transport system permease protein